MLSCKDFATLLDTPLQLFPLSFTFLLKKNYSHCLLIEPPTISYVRTNISITDATEQKRVRITIGGSIIVIKGMSIIVRCPADGIPEPRITWNKVNRTSQLDSSRTYVTHDNDLMIADGRVSDSGVWECRAKNKVGEAIGRTVIAVAG